MANARFHKVESWRDRLVSDPEATTAFLEQFPEIDRQQFGQKVRAARKERQTGKPAGAGKALFRLIDGQIAKVSSDQP